MPLVLIIDLAIAVTIFVFAWGVSGAVLHKVEQHRSNSFVVPTPYVSRTKAVLTNSEAALGPVFVRLDRDVVQCIIEHREGTEDRD